MLKKVSDLSAAGIELVMVFDGAPMPCKEQTEENRKSSRQENLKKAQELEKLKRFKEAEKYYTRAVDVTPNMAKEVIEELQKINIECIVAPYEADAQLAYLCRIGYIDGVISEDSDLIVFESTKILFKLEGTGRVKELLLKDLPGHPSYNLSTWTHDKFIHMCVLAGCDYLKSVRSIGLITAYKYVSQHSDITQVIAKLKREISNTPKDYEILFFKAIYSFKYHKVYCPQQRAMVNLNPLPAEPLFADLSFLGESLAQPIMIGIANSQLHPFTKQPFHELSLKRKLPKSFQQPITQKLIKPVEEPRSLAQRIRVISANSKYFPECKENFPEEQMPDGKLLINPRLFTKFKPLFKESVLETPRVDQEQPTQVLKLRRIDLTSIFIPN